MKETEKRRKAKAFSLSDTERHQMMKLIKKSGDRESKFSIGNKAKFDRIRRKENELQ